MLNPKHLSVPSWKNKFEVHAMENVSSTYIYELNKPINAELKGLCGTGSGVFEIKFRLFLVGLCRKSSLRKFYKI